MPQQESWHRKCRHWILDCAKSAGETHWDTWILSDAFFWGTIFSESVGFCREVEGNREPHQAQCSGISQRKSRDLNPTLPAPAPPLLVSQHSDRTTAHGQAKEAGSLQKACSGKLISDKRRDSQRLVKEKVFKLYGSLQLQETTLGKTSPFKQLTLG